MHHYCCKIHCPTLGILCPGRAERKGREYTVWILFFLHVLKAELPSANVVDELLVAQVCVQ